MPNGLNALIATGGGYEAPNPMAIKQNALAMQGQEMKLQDEQFLRPMKNEMAALQYFRDLVPTITADNYEAVKQQAISKGVPPHVFPNLNDFLETAQTNGIDPNIVISKWGNAVGTTIAQKIELAKVRQQGWVPGSKAEAIEVAGAKTGTRKVGDKQTYQKGDTEVTERWNGSEWEVIGSGPKWNPKSDEFEVSTDKEGNVTVRKGPAGAAGGPQMTKPTQTKIEGKLFDSTNALSRLQSIEQAFKPEYMTWKTKLGQQVTSWKSKAGIEVSQEDKQKRTEFAQFQRRAMSNLNAYLNELSGAAITEQEAKRLTQAMPDALKDDPIEFESKMRDVMEELKLSITRYNYLLANGWTEQQIIGNVKKNQIQSVGSFRSQIQARAKEIEQELKASGTDERDIRNMVTERLRQEFKL